MGVAKLREGAVLGVEGSPPNHKQNDSSHNANTELLLFKVTYALPYKRNSKRWKMDFKDNGWAATGMPTSHNKLALVLAPRLPIQFPASVHPWGTR